MQSVLAGQPGTEELENADLDELKELIRTMITAQEKKASKFLDWGLRVLLVLTPLALGFAGQSMVRNAQQDIHIQNNTLAISKAAPQTLLISLRESNEKLQQAIEAGLLRFEAQVDDIKDRLARLEVKVQGK